jgi:hypothetical protein
MAFGKHRHGIDMGILEGLAKGISIKGGPDAGDQVGRVEIKVDLAKTHHGPFGG